MRKDKVSDSRVTDADNAQTLREGNVPTDAARRAADNAKRKALWRAKRSKDPVIRANDLAAERTRDATRRADDADNPHRLAAERTRDAARRKRHAARRAADNQQRLVDEYAARRASEDAVQKQRAIDALFPPPIKRYGTSASSRMPPSSASSRMPPAPK